MKPIHRKMKKQKGFTLIEMMISAGIFVTICGAVLSLLDVAQKRYQTDSQVLSAFQNARLAIDQITRDINDAGYPPRNQFGSALAPFTNYASTPVAWSPNYLLAPCAVSAGTCISPGNFDLIIETDIDPQNNNGVEWVRYQLQGTTLLRGVVSKAAGIDPVAATGGAMAPYITNVMNNAPAAQIAAMNAVRPGLFPGGNPVPVFTYSCDNPTGQPVACAAAGANDTPINIRDVNITLIVLATQSDMQSGQIRAVSLNGRGHRVNPNQ